MRNGRPHVTRGPPGRSVAGLTGQWIGPDVWLVFGSTSSIQRETMYNFLDSGAWPSRSSTNSLRPTSTTCVCLCIFDFPNRAFPPPCGAARNKYINKPSLSFSLTYNQPLCDSVRGNGNNWINYHIKVIPLVCLPSDFLCALSLFLCARLLFWFACFGFRPWGWERLTCPFYKVFGKLAFHFTTKTTFFNI